MKTKNLKLGGELWKAYFYTSLYFSFFALLKKKAPNKKKRKRVHVCVAARPFSKVSVVLCVFRFLFFVSVVFKFFEFYFCFIFKKIIVFSFEFYCNRRSFGRLIFHLFSKRFVTFEKTPHEIDEKTHTHTQNVQKKKKRACGFNF